MDMIPGYMETGGAANRDGMKMVGRETRRRGASHRTCKLSFGSVPRRILRRPRTRNRRLATLASTPNYAPNSIIPVLGVQPYTTGVSNPNLPPIVEYVEGRGGYKHAKFDLADALAAPRAADAPDEEDLWARHVKHYTAICDGRGAGRRESGDLMATTRQSDAQRLSANNQQLRVVRSPIQ